MKFNLKTHFEKYLEKENLEGKTLLLCVSGGVDSCVLLQVASKVVNSNDLAVFHLDHNTRESSKNDALFVQEMCSNLNIQFFKEILEKQETRPSNLENFWREARAQKMQKVAQKCGADKILTAHHASDFCETMIFRLTKGAGLSGLFPFDISTKPFWNIPRNELVNYAEKNQISWVEDPSNNDLNFQRNRIRHKVIPELKKITPNLEKVMLREAEIFQNAQSFIETSLENAVDLKAKKLALKNFLELPLILKQEFLRQIAQKTPSFSEIEDGLKWLENEPQGGSEKLIGGTKVHLEKGCLRWE